MNRKAALCIIFASYIILTEGNNVTLLPEGFADVRSGQSLSLQCVYNGAYNPFTFNFYLNPDTSGLQIRKSNCLIVSTVVYNTSLYSQSCGTNNVSLTILNVSQDHDGKKWECDVTFLSSDPIPPKASTIIRVTAATIPSSSGPATNVSNASTLESTEKPKCELELGLGLGLGLGIPCVITVIVVVIYICTEVSSIQTYVGSEAHFNFMLTEDSSESEVHIKNKSGGVVMSARGKVGRSDDPFYKDRVNFTGNTDRKLISFILRNVTLSDAGIYTAVHSDANRIIGCQMLIVKGCKRPYILGLVLGLGLGIIFIVGCIIIAILISTGTTLCKLELGLGLGLGSGTPYLIAIILAVIFAFVLFLFKGIPNRVKFGKGIIRGLLFASVIGIIVWYLICTNDEDNPQETDGKKHEQVRLEPTVVSSVQTYVGSEAHFNFMLTEDPNESEVHIKNKSGGVVMSARGEVGRSGDPVYKDRVNFTGNTNQKLISFILRNVTLSDAGIYTAVHSDANRIIGCQMLIVKVKKGKTKHPGAGNPV